MTVGDGFTETASVSERVATHLDAPPDAPDELLLRASMAPIDTLTLRVLAAKEGSQARLVARRRTRDNA